MSGRKHSSRRLAGVLLLLAAGLPVVVSEAPSAVAATGNITEFAVPNALGKPAGITSGPDGNLWFAQSVVVAGQGSGIGRLSPSGTFKQFPLPTPGDDPNGAGCPCTPPLTQLLRTA